MENDAGPVMVTVSYHIDPASREAFLTHSKALARERKRDGAYASGRFPRHRRRDERLLESFFLDSWLDHLRQHKRVINADRALEDHVRSFLKAKPIVTHFVAAFSKKRRAPKLSKQIRRTPSKAALSSRPAY